MIQNKNVENIGFNKIVSFPHCQQKIDDVTWSQEGKYMVLLNKHLVSVDTYNSSNDIETNLTFERKFYQTPDQIICLSNQKMLIRYGERLYQMPYLVKQNIDKIQTKELEMPSKYQIIYFHKSMAAYAISTKLNQMNVINLETGQKFYLPCRYSILGLGDNESLITISRIGKMEHSNKVILFDLKTKQFKNIVLPQKAKINLTRDSLFLINDNEAVIGFHDNAEYIISTVTLTSDGKIQNALKLYDVANEVGGVSFLTFNKNTSMLAILVLTALNRDQKIMLLNYHTGQVYWQHPIGCTNVSKVQKDKSTKLENRIFDFGKRFSRDLKNYLVIVKPMNEHIMQFQLFKYKKMYFNLFKKSGLEGRFGERMARLLFGVLL